MAIKLQTVDRESLEDLRAERDSYFNPVYVGVGATLMASSIFASALICGSSLGMHWAFDGSMQPLKTGFTALAALTEVAACMAVVHDRAHGRERFFPRTSWLGMALAVLAFVTAAMQWKAARLAGQPTSARGVILLGYGAWAASVAFLAGSPTDFIMLEVDDQPALATVDETVDEKTPLMALAVGGLSA